MHETHFPESTALHSAAYDEETQELTVRLRSGRIYIHRGVPHGEYDALISADSVGHYYDRHIRDDYPFSEIVRYESAPDRSRRAVINPPLTSSAGLVQGKPRKAAAMARSTRVTSPSP